MQRRTFALPLLATALLLAVLLLCCEPCAAQTNTTTTAAATTTTTIQQATTSITTSRAGTTGANNTGGINGTTAAGTNAAGGNERQSLQWYHVAVAVAIGFLLAFGTCYAVCVWQQTAVRDYEGGIETFLKEVGLMRRKLADEVEDREEQQAKKGQTNELFEKYKAEELAKKEALVRAERLKRNAADAGLTIDDGKGGGGAGKEDTAAAKAMNTRTQNLITFKQQRAQEIRGLQALSRVGAGLGVVGGTGTMPVEPEFKFVDRSKVQSLQSTRAVAVAAPADSGARHDKNADPLQMALGEALATQRALHNLKTSAQMRSLQTDSIL